MLISLETAAVGSRLCVQTLNSVYGERMYDVCVPSKIILQ